MGFHGEALLAPRPTSKLEDHPLSALASTCEYGDEPSGSKNAGNFLTSCRTS